MNKILLGCAMLPFFTGIASAANLLSDPQMDLITGGEDLVLLPCDASSCITSRSAGTSENGVTNITTVIIPIGGGSTGGGSTGGGSTGGGSTGGGSTGGGSTGGGSAGGVTARFASGVLPPAVVQFLASGALVVSP